MAVVYPGQPSPLYLKLVTSLGEHSKCFNNFSCAPVLGKPAQKKESVSTIELFHSGFSLKKFCNAVISHGFPIKTYFLFRSIESNIRNGWLIEYLDPLLSIISSLVQLSQQIVSVGEFGSTHVCNTESAILFSIAYAAISVSIPPLDAVLLT